MNCVVCGKPGKLVSVTDGYGHSGKIVLCDGRCHRELTDISKYLKGK